MILNFIKHKDNTMFRTEATSIFEFDNKYVFKGRLYENEKLVKIHNEVEIMEIQEIINNYKEYGYYIHY